MGFFYVINYNIRQNKFIIKKECENQYKYLTKRKFKELRITYECIGFRYNNTGHRKLSDNVKFYLKQLNLK